MSYEQPKAHVVLHAEHRWLIAVFGSKDAADTYADLHGHVVESLDVW